MKKLFLPNDYARCEGVPTSEGWRIGCADCLRRICDPPSGPYVISTAPPDLVKREFQGNLLPSEAGLGECPSRIESDGY